MPEKPTYEALERRIAELESRIAELTRAEETLDLALESARVGSWEWDLRSGRAGYDDRWARTLGHWTEGREPRASDWEGLLHPDDKPRVLEAMARHQRKLSPSYQAEFRLRTGSGEWRWLQSRGKVVERDGEGKPLRMVGVHLDIHDQKKIEEALRDSEEKYRIMTETAPDAVITTDLEGNITHVSKRGLEVFGYDRAEELLGRSAFDLMAPPDPERVRDLVEGAREEGIRRDERYSLARRDGTAFTGEASAAVIRDAEGELRGFVVIVRDITDRIKAEEMLQASERQFRTLVETSLAGICIIQDPEARYVNPAAARMFGYEMNEVIGALKPLSFVHPEDRAAAEEYLGRCLVRRAGTIPFSFRGLRRDGVVIDCEVLGRLIDFEGLPAVIGTIIDVSERKRTERELLRAQKLDSVGVLAGGVAHDFNNIIMAVWGNIDLAKMEMGAEAREFGYLDEAERACRRAQALSQQLITFSKGGAPVKKPISVARVVREAADLSLSGSNVRCELSLPDHLGSAWADEGQMDQVFNNLFLNAIQAMPEGGTVQVSAENTAVEEAGELPLKPGRYLEISVQDHGIGIKKENLSKVFDPYFTTKQKGSGLGLAVVHSIVSKHDGHVSLESEVGVGTRFRIHLPACETGVVETEMPRDEVATGQGKILVMDDEEMIREIVAEFAVHLGYEVELAQDGAEAVSLFRRAFESGEPFDVAVLDLTVPGGMGGKEALKRFQEIDPSARAIVSSGYSNDPVMADCKEYGFVGTISKPYEMGTLGEVLKRVISMPR